MLPYKVKVGEKTLTSLRNTQKYVILANNTCKFIYTETKLGPKFNIKYKISKKHKHDLIYKAQCPYLNCDETFVGEISSGSTSSIFHPHAAKKILQFFRSKSYLWPHIQRNFRFSRKACIRRIPNLHSAIFLLFDTFCGLVESQLSMHQKLFPGSRLKISYQTPPLVPLFSVLFGFLFSLV